MPIEEAVKTKALIEYLDELFADAKLGKKNRDKVINHLLIRKSGDSLLNKLYDAFRSMSYNTK